MALTVLSATEKSSEGECKDEERSTESQIYLYIRPSPKKE